MPYLPLPHIGLACVLALANLGAAPSDGETTILDFETPAHAASLARKGNPVCAVSTERASRGKRSLRSAFVRYEPGMPQWPNLRLELQPLGALTDWRPFSELLIDMYVDSQAGVLVKVSLRSPN